jgi:hypothetical protein
MHGVKVYRGTAAAAQNYVDADRSRTVGLQIHPGTGRTPVVYLHLAVHNQQSPTNTNAFVNRRERRRSPLPILVGYVPHSVKAWELLVNDS